MLKKKQNRIIDRKSTKKNPFKIILDENLQVDRVNL